jgi:pimeloyl-ACP methyl ester carboxylesterase
LPFARCHSAGRVHYAERGEMRPGRRAVMLIHGAGASSAIWMMVLARLGRITRAVAIDLPGHGPSGLPAGDTPATIPTYRDATGELAGLIGLGPSVLVGHSMGALVAIDAALAWPDKVVGLVLCAAAPRLPVSEELFAVLRKNYLHFPEWLAERALSPSAKPGLRRAFIAAGVVAPQSVTLADFEAINAVDLGARLGELRCPIVWLDGADDRIVRSIDSIAERPGKVRRLPSVGHLVPIEAPAEVAEAVRELSEIEGVRECVGRARL